MKMPRPIPAPAIRQALQARLRRGSTAPHWAGAFVMGQQQRDVYGRTALHLAKIRSKAGVVQLLLAAGADPNATDSDGNTALHWAAYWGRAGLVARLLQHGSNVHHKDTRGRTALLWAQVDSYVVGEARVLDLVEAALGRSPTE